MKLEAKIEDIKNARDKRKLESYIDNHVLYLTDLYDTINYLLVDAELTAIETLAAAREYIDRFGEADAEDAEEKAEA